VTGQRLQELKRGYRSGLIVGQPPAFIPEKEPGTSPNRPWPGSLGKGFQLGDWSVFPAENSICRDDQRVRLEPKVMQLLKALVAKCDAPCSRDDLLNQLWPSLEVGDSALTRCMSELRKALGDRGKPSRYIDTIQNFGYKVIAPVRTLGNAGMLPIDDEPRPSCSSEAEELMKLSRYLLGRLNQNDVRQAIDILQGGPDNLHDDAPASALLAHAESLLLQFKESAQVLHVRRARRCARRALEIDGTIGLAWAVLGSLARKQWRWNRAFEHFGRARALHPRDAIVLQEYAELLLRLGRLEQARALAEHARRRCPTAAGIRLVYAWVLLNLDDPQSQSELSMARHYGAEPRLCDNLEGLLLHREGWTDGGIRVWTELNQRRIGDPGWMWPPYLVEGLVEGAVDAGLVKNVRERALRGHLDSGVAPCMLTIAGALDGAFELARIAIEQHRFFLASLWLDEMVPFREDPRFVNVHRGIGLGERDAS